MSRLGISTVKTGFLVAAGLLLAGGAAWAQAAGRGGIGHAGGIGYAGGFQHGGMGNLYGSGFNRGAAFTPGHLYGRGYGLGYGLGYGYGLYGRGYGANLGFSSGLRNGYGLGYQTFSNPNNYNYGGYRVPYLYGTPAIQGYSSAYSAPQRQARVTPADNAAHLQVIVPANAELWFNGSKTSRTGARREFVSPPLTAGKSYTYDIKARWMQDGEPVEQTRSVQVRANDWQQIDFTRPETPAATAK